MKLGFSHGVFTLTDCTPREAKRHGFALDKERFEWCTRKLKVAAPLRAHADKSARTTLTRYLIEVSPWRGRVPHPPGLTVKEFQHDAVKWLLSRNRGYLAADPGLGKSVMTALAINALAATGFGRAACIVCPPSLVETLRYELEKWLAWYPVIKRCDELNPEKADILIVPDSILSRTRVLKAIKAFVKAKKEEGAHPVLIVDEAHRFKSFTARRTEYLFDLITKQFTRRYLMSGTPLPNRTMDLYPALSREAPECIDFMNMPEYGYRYCAGHFDGRELNFKGDSNTEELGRRVKDKYMLRLLKRDVLPELPPLTEEVVILSPELPKAVAKLERAILAKASPEDLMKGKLRNSDHMASYRQALGIAKVPLALPWLLSLLEDTQENLLVFALHKEVVRLLALGLKAYAPLVIAGYVPVKKRQGLVDAFQKEKKHRLLICNIDAAGEGYTITKADRAIFVEFTWSDAKNKQAIDRILRIGRVGNVLAQYCLFKNSIDRPVIETALRKRGVAKHI